MARNSKAEIAEILLTLVPRDGAAAGNQHLRRDPSARLGREVGEDEYEAAKLLLIDRGGLFAARAAEGPCDSLTHSKGGFGTWCWDVAFDPAQVHDLLQRAG